MKETQHTLGSQGEPLRAGIGGCQETAARGTRSVAACIVSFNPGPELRLALCSVLPQVSTVFVIDNASSKESEVAQISPQTLCRDNLFGGRVLCGFLRVV